jgi:hypothetical protein
LSCANDVIPQYRRHWCPFLEDPSFLASPSPPRGLLIYAETVDFVLAAQPSPSMHRKTRHYNRHVLDFIKLEAKSCQLITTIDNDVSFLLAGLQLSLHKVSLLASFFWYNFTYPIPSSYTCFVFNSIFFALSLFVLYHWPITRLNIICNMFWFIF